MHLLNPYLVQGHGGGERELEPATGSAGYRDGVHPGRDANPSQGTGLEYTLDGMSVHFRAHTVTVIHPAYWPNCMSSGCPQCAPAVCPQ